MTSSTCHVMMNNTVLWSMNTVTWDSLDVLVQLIVYTLAGTSALVNIFTCTQAKEGFPSIAYEVICSSRKFIQAVSPGHPGARNDKHIVRTDVAVLKFLQGNGWLHSKVWSAVLMSGAGNYQSFHGLYLICDGGYLRWPCLVHPSKTGLAKNQTMRWSAMLESVHKDIEGVFGILKKRFAFLKVFNHMHHQQHIDNAFVTCCKF